MKGSKAGVVALTAMTPIDEERTEVHQIFWTSLGWLRWAGPLVRHLMRVFLDQDRRVVVRQREGLLHDPKLMLINDADTQARWWSRVKAEWRDALAAGRPFNNPLKPQTLRWRS